MTTTITMSVRRRWEETFRSAHVSHDDRDEFDPPDVADEFVGFDRLLFWAVIDRYDWATQFEHLIQLSNEENQ